MIDNSERVGMSWRQGSNGDPFSAASLFFGSQEGNSGVIDKVTDNEEKNSWLLSEPNTQKFREKQLDYFIRASRKRFNDPKIQEAMMAKIERLDVFGYHKEEWEKIIAELLKKDGSEEAYRRSRSYWNGGLKKYHEWAHDAFKNNFSVGGLLNSLSENSKLFLNLINTDKNIPKEELMAFINSVNKNLLDIRELFVLIKENHHSSLIEKYFPNDSKIGQNLYWKFEHSYDYFKQDNIFIDFCDEFNEIVIHHGVLSKNQSEALLLRKDMERIAIETIGEIKKDDEKTEI